VKRTHLGLQAFFILLLIALVSWPEFRPVRAASVWRYSPEALTRAQAEELAGFSYEENAGRRARQNDLSYRADIREAATTQGRTRGADDIQTPTFTPPAAVTEVGGQINAVLGRARTSLNTPIPYARVLLRNIRTGAIEKRATANEEGRYTFLDVNDSAYIVELIGSDGSVVASSEMVAMAAGDVRETTVRVSANANATAATFNNRLGGTLTESTINAQLNNVTRTAGTQDLRSTSPSTP
jgi:hypothetical protein